MTKGISLIEVVIGSAVISTVLLAVGAVAQYSVNVSNLSTERLQTVFLASEGMEAFKIMRDSSWTTNISPLAPSATYYLKLVNAGRGYYKYIATTTVQTPIDGRFTRTFTIEDVLRDFNDDIASSGVVDVDARKVNFTVSWTSVKNQLFDENISAYVFNLYSN